MKHRLFAAVLAVSLTILPFSGVPLQAASPDSSAIQEFVLPSGQTLYVKEDHDQPIVTIDTWVKTGSVNEVTENNGVSHFLEHLIFKGTDVYKAGEIDRILETKGAKFNAATSDDYTHYYITTASPFFEETLKLHASMLERASIPPDELTRERKVVQEEINRATDNPDHKRFDALSQLLYDGHGYSLDTLGPKENIAKIPRENILSYYQYWYQPKNFNTVITGDIDSAKALELVKKYFGETPNTKGATAKTQQTTAYAPPEVGRPHFPTSPKTKVIQDPSVTQAYFTLGFPAPSIEEQEDLFALDVAMLVLGSGASSRLYQALHEKTPLVTSVGSGNMTQKYSGILYVDAEMKPENREAFKQELMRQLKELKANGITTAELEKAKTQTIKDFIFHNEATEGVASSIGYNVTIGHLKDYTDYVANVQKVSQDDVKKALNRYLDFNKAVLVELLPPRKVAINDQEEANLRYLAGAVNPNPTTVTKNPAPTQVEAQKVEPTKEILSNGMTVLMKPMKDSKTVAIKIFVKGGQAAESVPGVSTLTAPLLMKGTRERTAEMISEELESKGMNLSISSHEDYVEVSGSAVSEDLGELFLLIQDVLNNPSFATDEIEKEKDHVKQAILSSWDSPSSLAMENLSLGLYPNHPYGNVGKRIESNLEGISRDQLVEYFNTYFAPKNMVVSVVGNFEPATVRKYLETGFDVARNSQPDVAKAIAKTPAVAPLVKAEVLEEKKPIKGATWIVQGWLAPTIDSPDYVPLKVLNTLLGSGMSSRLFVNLREKQGLAYVVSSAFPTLEDRSNFFLFIGTDPKNRATVIDGFKNEIAKLKNEIITPQELQESKDKLRGAFALAHETNGSQSFYLAFYETLGVGYQFDEKYPGLIDKVTAADIQRVAKKYFSAPDVMSIVSPDEKADTKASGSGLKSPEENGTPAAAADDEKSASEGAQ